MSGLTLFGLTRCLFTRHWDGATWSFYGARENTRALIVTYVSASLLEEPVIHLLCRR